MKEACGIFGIVSLDGQDVSGAIYNGLIAVQHRGQESCGIATLNGPKIHLSRKMGLVTSFRHSDIANLKGSMGIGHVRYSTVGSSSIVDAQPFKTDYPKKGIVLGHNGNIVNFLDRRRHFSESGRNLTTDCDAELMVYSIAEEYLNAKDIWESVRKVMLTMEGSYSTVFFTGEGDLVAFRDPQGFRPLSFGRNGNLVAFASESAALDINGINNIETVNPGEMILVTRKGEVERRQLTESRKSHCMFEYVYFSRPDSRIDDQYIYDVRVRLGKNLAKANPSKADVVVPVPDTARPAAVGISQVLGIPMAEGLMKNRYISRTFIMPSQGDRDNAVRLKLNPVKSILKDKHVILVDDSIVRGTTSRKIVNLVRQAGARKVELWVTCPPIISPCFYGIDISTHKELIAVSNSIPEIEKHINVDKLNYQTIEGLVDAIGVDKKDLCLGCLTERYPTELAQNLADRMKTQKTLQNKRYWEME